MEVITERVWRQTLSTGAVDLDEMIAYARNGKASQAVLDAFRKAAGMQATINNLNERISRLNQEANAISEDQRRIRENMGRIDRQSDLFVRYMTKLNEQENRLESIAEERIELTGERDRVQAELRAYLQNLTVN